MAVIIDKEMRRRLYQSRYPKGSVLRLTKPIDDPYTPKKIGDEFISSGIVDSELQLMGYWRSGGSMALRLEDDSYELVTK